MCVCVYRVCGRQRQGRGLEREREREKSRVGRDAVRSFRRGLFPRFSSRPLFFSFNPEGRGERAAGAQRYKRALRMKLASDMKRAAEKESGTDSCERRSVSTALCPLCGRRRRKRRVRIATALSNVASGDRQKAERERGRERRRRKNKIKESKPIKSLLCSSIAAGQGRMPATPVAGKGLQPEEARHSPRRLMGPASAIIIVAPK